MVCPTIPPVKSGIPGARKDVSRLRQISPLVGPLGTLLTSVFLLILAYPWIAVTFSRLRSARLVLSSGLLHLTGFIAVL
jgi:hypothetical protein